MERLACNCFIGVGENHRMSPGYAHIPWNELGAAVRKIGYQGNVVMEPFLMPGG